MSDGERSTHPVSLQHSSRAYAAHPPLEQHGSSSNLKADMRGRGSELLQ
jgi:hypothetical protein